MKTRDLNSCLSNRQWRVWSMDCALLIVILLQYVIDNNFILPIMKYFEKKIAIFHFSSITICYKQISHTEYSLLVDHLNLWFIVCIIFLLRSTYLKTSAMRFSVGIHGVSRRCIIIYICKYKIYLQYCQRIEIILKPMFIRILRIIFFMYFNNNYLLNYEYFEFNCNRTLMISTPKSTIDGNHTLTSRV
ncbi:hypothetical protein AGLY_005197 [Aphis glycines]|uniref:Uncharacterized protein n=1 Tax=Aphis glycines TaxID=307491 RepID=A0A6G0TW13_APHGL|nr:hypothetical protein AGLY_005197 [Aphis glycines]